MAKSEHFVQFYEEDAFLVRSLAGFIEAGLTQGENILIVVTRPHRVALEHQLRQDGFDPALLNADRYVVLDAAETLEEFMVDGSPDERLFEQEIRSLMQRFTRSGRSVRAFGEMVALLWERGNTAAAIRLEELWNDLRKEFEFRLFCAYPMKVCRGEKNEAPFLHICQTHTRVIPAESYTGQADDDERLRAISVLQQKAISLETEILNRKRVEETLEARVAERTAQLRQTVAELEAFSYSISHDMRSPLRAMQGYARILIDEYGEKLEPQAIETLNRIQRASQRLDMLVRDVLSYSKVAKAEIKLQAVALGELLEDLISQQPEFDGARQCIKVHYPLDPVLGHEGCLIQCFTNLIANALKFVKPGVPPAVQIRTERLGDKIRIWVIDNGIGISEEHHDRIFQIFGRVYSDTRYPGTGIGLAIVKKAVTRMGGEIGCESTLGEGSRFWFTLPSPESAHVAMQSAG